MSGSEQCEGKTYGEPCRNAATHTISYFCVHEHGGTWPECQVHVDHAIAAMTRGDLICRPCYDADGHDCSFRLVGEPKSLLVVADA